MKDGHYYLLDVFRERLDYPALKKRMRELAYKYQADTVLIEDKGSGTSLIQDLRSEKGRLHPIACMPNADKITRLSAVSAEIEAGKVWLPKEAPWLDNFKVELLAFPLGKHDDQVDSVSQFLKWISDRKRMRFGEKKLKA